ncbi:glycosyltransferase family 8 protein [Citromicrobium bathyomarinum]|uniref:glycosyltransferase family 8 protein n=1 Tax=Citromicrobium bathyomarinum TaxID=72174 RepID=UPI00315AD706
MKRLCLATVTTDNYLVGTLVTLHSFFATNPWFDGEVVLITKGLNASSKAHIEAVVPQARYHAPSHDLNARLDMLYASDPKMVRKRPRFHAIEAFRLEGYERVLFIDSDLLFRGSIEGLLSHEGQLVACGDGAFYKGKRRSWMPATKTISTFNSGVISIAGSLIEEGHYRGLLDLIEYDDPDVPIMHLTDQLVLNIHFAGKASMAVPQYNYLFVHEHAIREATGLSPADARVLHFNGRHKPWDGNQVLLNGVRQPAFTRACIQWYEALEACLADLHLQKVGALRDPAD